MKWQLLLLLLPLIRAKEECPNGGLMDPSDGKCYNFIPVLQTYEQAKEICQSFYGFPVTIDSGFRSHFIATEAKKYLPEGEFWIGLTNTHNDNRFRWMDNHGPLKFTNWAQGYPLKDENKLCVSVRSTDGQWINVNCNEQKRYFICQSNPKHFIGRCMMPAGDINEKCNQMISVQQTYSEAEKICSSFGTNLATIDNNLHIHNLNEFAKKKFNGSDYWIGLSNHKTTGIHQWSNGKLMKFTNWAKGYPNTKVKTSCVAVQLNDGGWYNLDCDMSKRFFTCEQPLARSIKAVECPETQKWGPGPPSEALCPKPSDPNNMPPSALENWFTREMFYDLFPHANLAWGPTSCWPYSYEAFVYAARYFPEFGTSSPNTVYTPEQNYRRDVAAFLSHAVQETGENYNYYFNVLPLEEAKACFYRGGFFNWFEGGPVSGYLYPKYGYDPADGDTCAAAGSYCDLGLETSYYYPCRANPCYFGRGAIQISWNYNYGPFSEFLNSKGIKVDLLANPNLVLTKMDPPISIMASLWFYMTPQPPKPSMHDIVLGKWNAGAKNKAAGYSGPIFGPTSQVINNECGGESDGEPGGGGENRRIKAFRWFNGYFGAPVEADNLLTCKGMPEGLLQMQYNACYHPDFNSIDKAAPCECIPIHAGGIMFYYDPEYYPDYVGLNEESRKRCVKSIYEAPQIYALGANSECIKHPPSYVTNKN